MKAKFKSNGSIVTGEAAKVFVKIGLAEEIKPDIKNTEVIEKPLADIKSQPKAANPIVVRPKKSKGRPKKSKK